MQASKSYEERGSRVVIIVDGLDHIPREELPDHSLLKVLPTPQSLPDGVLFILGTQSLDLSDIPGAVQQQANEPDRRVNIAPLPLFAITAMTEAFGLTSDVEPSRVFELGGGHPLATRYLLEQLAVAGKDDRDLLLSESQPFGGDLEAVYASAWRGIDKQEGSSSLKKVLALLAHAEGRITPHALAKATSDEAVEAALAHVRHLLDISAEGWQIFHNSFRLFVRRKPVLRFGQPDDAFESRAIYLKLAELVDGASSKSDQSWLKFRYLFLSGNLERATELATRSYFVDQYCEGRPAHTVRADVSDALRALEDNIEPVKLFDLMLADDEVSRRANIMESATSLIDAQLAIGDLRAACSSLSGNYQDGKQWLVIDALLAAGQIETARRIFENHNPFGALSDRASPFGRSNATEAFPWAQRAIILLSEEQIKGGDASALFYSLVETCRLNGVEPETWFTDVIERIGNHPINRIDELLPWKWQATRKIQNLEHAA